jgi:hypothetical protein
VAYTEHVVWPTISLQPMVPGILAQTNAHWYRPKTCRLEWVGYTLLPPLQSTLRSPWAPNSWTPGSRTSLRRHMLPKACCTASWQRYLRENAARQPSLERGRRDGSSSCGRAGRVWMND